MEYIERTFLLFYFNSNIIISISYLRESRTMSPDLYIFLTIKNWYIKQNTFENELYSTSVWLHFRHFLLCENWVIFKADHVFIRSCFYSVWKGRIDKSLASIGSLSFLLCSNNPDHYYLFIFVRAGSGQSGHTGISFQKLHREVLELWTWTWSRPLCFPHRWQIDTKWQISVW